jgi:glycosyltransferase involved in cell wall biosynthesis
MNSTGDIAEHNRSFAGLIRQRSTGTISPSMVKLFSVIIPTYDRAATLNQCLEALANLDYPRANFEVVVVDDGGSSSLESVLEPWRGSLQLQLLRQENAGPAAARNRGAREANGDWLVFLDDDCVPHRDWLRAFADAAHDPGEVLGGLTINAVANNPYSAASGTLLDYLAEYFFARESSLRFFPSNNLALSSGRFRQLGGFDSAFRSAAGEDREFCDRWLESGGRLCKVPGAIVQHSRSLSLSTFVHQHFRYGQGAFVFHSLRAKRNAARRRLEPFSFYSGLIHFPWREERGWSAWRSAVLLGISQLANAAGFFWAKIRNLGGRKSLP